MSKQYITSGFVVLIDAFDQALREACPTNIEAWKAGQRGLAKAAHSLFTGNHHIKTITTIRQEAWSEFIDEQREVLENKSITLEYSDSELKKIFANAITRYTKKRSIESFLNARVIHNAYCGVDEDPFVYILRHSTGSPRSLMAFGKGLTELNLERFSGDTLQEKIRDKVDSISSDNLLKDYLMSQKSQFLRTLNSNARIQFLLRSIPSNVLTLESLHAINKLFSEKTHIPPEDSHPFCELYNIGLLGHVRQDVAGGGFYQYFRKPQDFDWTLENIIPENSVFLLHPGLASAISTMRFIHLNRVNVIGPDLPWQKIGGKDGIPNIFISYSSEDLKYVEEILNTLRDRVNIKLPSTFWMDKWKIRHGSVIVHALANVTQYVKSFMSASEAVNGRDAKYFADRAYAVAGLEAIADKLGVTEYDPSAEQTALLEAIRGNTALSAERLSATIAAVAGVVGEVRVLDIGGFRAAVLAQGQASDATIAAWLQVLDSNGDGLLSLAEQQRGLELYALGQNNTLYQGVVALHSQAASGDATLDSFRVAMLAQGVADSAQADFWFRVLDANNDNSLSAQERQTALTLHSLGQNDAIFGALTALYAQGEALRARFDQYDANRDGGLDEAELAALVGQYGQASAAEIQALRATLDANGDRQISLQELIAGNTGSAGMQLRQSATNQLMLAAFGGTGTNSYFGKLVSAQEKSNAILAQIAENTGAVPDALKEPTAPQEAEYTNAVTEFMRQYFYSSGYANTVAQWNGGQLSASSIAGAANYGFSRYSDSRDGLGGTGAEAVTGSDGTVLSLTGVAQRYMNRYQDVYQAWLANPATFSPGGLTAQTLTQAALSHWSSFGRHEGRHLATGGFVSGVGGPTDDLNAAWLSHGEYVVRAAAVQALGVSTLDHVNATGSLPIAVPRPSQAVSVNVSLDPVVQELRAVKKELQDTRRLTAAESAELRRQLAESNKRLARMEDQLARRVA
ncbi:EF-hand domain-containing protein [Pararhodospirillum photometricum]|uniref:EF-hand domain-containing protein n=1 Tax=Pararhodospirillum photometricum TaxID=1084 RepID=UPI0012FF2B76|nr:EF-hand domain-containing protein [Pararhodospirillum photometricum]